MDRRSLFRALAAPVAMSCRGMGMSEALFQEIPSNKSGIRWVHNNAMSPQRYLPETMGPGVAFVDYDGDGWMDVFLVNSGPCDFFAPSKPVRHALYRNNRNGTFSDVTAKSGLGGGTSFGMGVAAGDYNNDGHMDLFVTAYGRATLYRNNGDGTFSDVTVRAGLAWPGWTTSAAWFDFNGDGLLDLFVCGFVEYQKADQASCTNSRGGQPGYCIPRVFRPSISHLYRNNGDGTFRDVSRETGIAERLGKALGVVVTDVNNDGLPDLFVANDTVENFLFVNRGKRFEDLAYGAMVALSPDGQARSGMGVDSADINGDGWQDLFVSNLDREMFTLYRNTRYGMFDDLSFSGEIGRATYLKSGWGTKFVDFDNDGALELIVANGHPDDKVSERTPQVSYREAPLLFAQRSGEWRDISESAGPAFQRPIASRGLAVGDYDNDGRIDVLIGVNGAAPVLLKNNADPRNNWVGVKLRGVKANRDGIGAVIRWQAGGMLRSHFKTGGGSYLSAHDPRVVLGLGKQTKLEWVEIQWPKPSSRRERFTIAGVNRYVTMAEGEGSAV